MIGRAELFLEFFGLGIALFFLSLGITYWRDPRQRKHGQLLTLLGCLLLLGFTVLFGTAFYHRQQLSTLTPAEVVQIQIGERIITDATAIAQIVAALHAVQAFSPNHEDAPQTPLILTLASGRRRYFHIKYRRSAEVEGIVLQFSTDATPGAGINQGYAFSAELLPVLRAQDILLSP